MKRTIILLLLTVIFFSILPAQDSIPSGRKYWTSAGIAAGAGTSLWVLNKAWYAQYEQESFHFFDDADEWLMMDKLGHGLTAYHVGQFGYHTFKWSGMKEKHALVFGGTLGFTYLTLVEVLDGFSSGWGFSWADAGGNAFGAGLYISQQALWKTQRIVPKFSAHHTSYAALRPEILGSDNWERILKDYNGQTYWLSFNLRSFFQSSGVPHWLSLSLGYSADGMISGKPVHNMPFSRKREWLLSLDADLWRIPGIKDLWVGKLLRSFGFIKIPFPALRIAGKEVFFEPLYF